METQIETAAVRAVRLLGGPVITAKKLGVDKYQTVQSWCKARVPVVYCKQIVALLNEDVKLWELRPDDWHLIWPELIDAEGAPAISAEQGA